MISKKIVTPVVSRFTKCFLLFWDVNIYFCGIVTVLKLCFWLADMHGPTSVIVILANSSKPLFWKIKSLFHLLLRNKLQNFSLKVWNRLVDIKYIYKLFWNFDNQIKPVHVSLQATVCSKFLMNGNLNEWHL